MAGDGLGYGISIGARGSGSVRGGGGNDFIAGYGTLFGISGDVDGGGGDDYFRARVIDWWGTERADQSEAVFGATISGGRGNDTFDVGGGDATLDGGPGNDTLLLLGSARDYTIQVVDENWTILRGSNTLNAVDIETVNLAADALLV